MTRIMSRKTKHTSYVHELFFWKLCRLWDNAVKYVRTGQSTVDNKIQCMSFACWLTRATNAHSEYVIPFFSQQHFMCSCLIVMLYTFVAFLVILCHHIILNCIIVTWNCACLTILQTSFLCYFVLRMSRIFTPAW